MTAPTTPKAHISHQSAFLRACRREDVPHTPIWLMRQAGRYMKDYRDLRSKVGMLELCKTPSLVSEVTVHAAQTLGVDAAILFADLLLIAEPFRIRLEYSKGHGPVLTPAIRDAKSIDEMPEADVGELEYVNEAVRQTRAELKDQIPLIGFAGCPFTVASYFVEGGGSRNFEHTKRLMYQDEGAWNALLAKVTRATIKYLNRQIDAGAQALQVFDSWVGALSPADYRRYVKPHSKNLIAGIRPGVPVVHFGTGTAALLSDMKEAGGTVIGLDWRVDLDRAWQEIGYDVGVMGNLDPILLQGPQEMMEAQATRILEQASGRNGHIFNLGHGILPATPVENVQRLVELVHQKSRR